MVEYNIYCDESCHLPNDKSTAMAIGSVWQLKDDVRRTATDLRQIKLKFGLPSSFEVKWTKVSPAKIDLYLSYLDYFFDNPGIHFRVIVIKDKENLQNSNFNQSHDEWYFNMFFKLLKVLISPEDKFNIYFDIQDTRSASKIKNLERLLCNYFECYHKKDLGIIQPVQSHHVEQIQLTDLLTGIFTFYHRRDIKQVSYAKQQLVQHFIIRSGCSLDESTSIEESKTNIYIRRAQ